MDGVDSAKPAAASAPTEKEVTFSFFDTSPLDARKYLDMKEFKFSFSDDENDNDKEELTLNGNGGEYGKINPLLNDDIGVYLFHIFIFYSNVKLGN